MRGSLVASSGTRNIQKATAARVLSQYPAELCLISTSSKGSEALSMNCREAQRFLEPFI